MGNINIDDIVSYKEYHIGISFIINFVIVRTHLGGFHCQKPLNCIVIFPIIYFCTILFLGILDFYTMSLVAIIILIIMLFVKPIRNNTCIEEKNILNVIKF
ncbi:MAG: accessory gene regulator B family protein [Faecalibacillus faecis]